MTEAAWLTTDDLEVVLGACRPDLLTRGYIGNIDPITRLLNATFARRAWMDITPSLPFLAAIETIERLTEGEATWNDTQAAVIASANSSENGRDLPVAVMLFGPLSTADRAISLAKFYGLSEKDEAQERKHQCTLARCVYGNPFRPVSLDPSCLLWNDGTVVRIARAIYADQAFCLMPILADALEESGCSNTEILNHLRGRGVHTRGCYALDMLVDKPRPSMR